MATEDRLALSTLKRDIPTSQFACFHIRLVPARSQQVNAGQRLRPWTCLTSVDLPGEWLTLTAVFRADPDLDLLVMFLA